LPGPVSCAAAARRGPVAPAYRDFLLTLPLVAAVCLAGPGRAVAQSETRDLAVIVHPSTADDDLTLDELRRIFRGEQARWSDGVRVVLFVQRAGTVEGESVVRAVCAMTGTEYQRYWVTKAFREEPGSGPKVVASAAMARRLTARVPGAVAVIPASEVDGSVKVLRIDRRLPGAEFYPLRLATR
jgi:hypothetical protein